MNDMKNHDIYFSMYINNVSDPHVLLKSLHPFSSLFANILQLVEFLLNRPALHGKVLQFVSLQLQLQIHILGATVEGVRYGPA
jgi:hypothetical protein